ncbi:helix-turn-helix transcriptional regulator [Paenibacillus profundus]|uniref:Helix-turn-helix transcriptional regulator n=1 Tax=Paenibacillus profundus TaxID=1173085 RepID=A0ABS8YP19_9BACL|nr:helix-turn-helix transcriptional regulator [Paenibacillus profundus]MCE5172375.1 helix-turn-helix transcriptional regulator [Paenibacillus profundus]
METKQLAKRIRAFRKLRGLTQQQLADRVRISVSVLGEMERGHREIDERTIIDISRELNISRDELATLPSIR